LRLEIITLLLAGLTFGWFVVHRVPSLLELMGVPPRAAPRPSNAAGERFRLWRSGFRLWRPRFRLWHLLLLMVLVSLACFAWEVGRRRKALEDIASLYERREQAALTYLKSRSFRGYLQGEIDRPFAEMGFVNDLDLDEDPLTTLVRTRSPEAVIRSLQDQAERNRRLKEFYRQRFW
jgi:hypothetical protein